LIVDEFKAGFKKVNHGPCTFARLLNVMAKELGGNGAQPV